MSHASPSSGGPAPWFTTTHWSIVLLARDGDSSAAFAALERLCRDYWRPVYSYVRRDGYGAADAEDLTQEFLSQFIHKDWLNHLQDQRGKFRSFLLTFLKHFLSDQRAHAGALKRGGGATIIPLDELAAEEHGALSTADSLSADQIFEQRWARTLLTRAETCLREEHVAAGQAGLYEALKDVLEGGATEDGYAQIAARFGMTESAIKSKVRRLRQRHQEILREEIGRTVSRREEIDEEIRYLISVLGR